MVILKAVASKKLIQLIQRLPETVDTKQPVLMFKWLEPTNVDIFV